MKEKKKRKSTSPVPYAACQALSVLPFMYYSEWGGQRPTSYCMAECAGTSYVAHALAVAQGLVPQWARKGPSLIPTNYFIQMYLK